MKVSPVRLLQNLHGHQRAASSLRGVKVSRPVTAGVLQEPPVSERNGIRAWRQPLDCARLDAAFPSPRVRPANSQLPRKATQRLASARRISRSRPSLLRKAKAGSSPPQSKASRHLRAARLCPATCLWTHIESHPSAGGCEEVSRATAAVCAISTQPPAAPFLP